MSEKKQLKIGLFLIPSGHHAGAWRHPASEPDHGLELAKFVRWAQTAERGKFDTIFLADTPALFGDGLQNGGGRPVGGFEPLTLLSAIAALTKNLGVIATASTTYSEPYNVARLYASLDHISGGRAGWNVVTSWVVSAAQNFGLKAHPEHAVRYARAKEYVDVVRGLWDSWEDDAFIRDKATGQYFEPSKLHALNHEGEVFSVRGPLNVPRPVQGHPVLVQAGASDTGRDLGAEIADVIFVASPDLEDARKFYNDIKGRAKALGRDADDIKILPGISPVIGRTREEAQAKLDELHDLVPDHIAINALSVQMGLDMSVYDPNGLVPEDLPPSNGKLSRQILLTALARRDNLTIRQLSRTVVAARGFLTVVGTAEDVADTMELWFKEGVADGFNVMPPIMPGGLDDFVDHVVPLLQERGIFRTEYEGKTLRENLGLKRPPNRFAQAREQARVKQASVANG